MATLGPVTLPTSLLGGGGDGGGDPKNAPTDAQFNARNPQYARQESQYGAGDSSVISFAGINLLNGQTLTWQQLAAMNDADAANTLVKAAGFNTDQANQLVLTLRKNKNIVWSGETPGDYQSLKEWTDPTFAKLANEVAGTVAQAKTHQLANQLTGSTDPASQAGQISPAMSTQALNDYYTQIMAPALSQYQSMVQGDMAQWGSMINQIKKDTAGADVNFATPNLQLYGQLQNLYGTSTMLNQAFGPYLQYQNALAGQNLKIGQAHEAQGAAISNLFQAAQSDPSLMNLLQTGGLGSLMGTAGTNPLSSIMNTVNPATAAITASGQSALNKNVQNAPLGVP